MTKTKKYVEGFGWALVDEVGNIWELIDEPDETDTTYNEQERQAEWEFEHGYNFE